MSIAIKRILMIILGLLLLLGIAGFTVDVVRNGFSFHSILMLMGALVVIGWWIRDFRNIGKKAKESQN